LMGGSLTGPQNYSELCNGYIWVAPLTELQSSDGSSVKILVSIKAKRCWWGLPDPAQLPTIWSPWTLALDDEKTDEEFVSVEGDNCLKLGVSDIGLTCLPCNDPYCEALVPAGSTEYSAPEDWEFNDRDSEFGCYEQDEDFDDFDYEHRFNNSDSEDLYVNTEGDMREADGYLKSEMCVPIFEDNLDSSHIAEITIGENLSSWRQILKRFFYSAGTSQSGGVNVVGNATMISAIIPNPNPTFPSSGGVTNETDVFTYLRYAFLGCRGSFRKRVRIVGLGNTDCLAHAKVKLSNFTNGNLITFAGYAPTRARLIGVPAVGPTDIASA